MQGGFFGVSSAMLELPLAVQGAVAEAAASSSTVCPKAISIYAMQKTGSTFLSRFSREIALHRKMCRAYQTTKEFVCQTTMYVDCPRNNLHRKTVSLVQPFSTQLPDEHRGPRCTQRLRQKMFDNANDWLRSTDVRVKYRYNRSLTWLLSADGFVRTSRQLYVEHTDGAVPSFPGYDNVLIVHTRHPVEMMVSAYNCIANPKVCPVRSKLLGSHVPKNDTMKSLDEFVLSGIRRPGSTPHAIMQRNRAIMRFIRGFGPSALRGASRTPGCSETRLLHSKYELMVTNFSVWSAQILEQMVSPRGQRRALHAALVKQYQNDFVPDGKHKKSLVAGSNMRKLQRSTIRELVRNERLGSLLRDLGYDWFGWDKRNDL